MTYKEGVPKYKTIEYYRKNSNYCLLIPIINEGEKIKLELERAYNYGIHKIVDIIILDGGSTDGCTNELDKWGINSLLVKKDIGKQGAQFRMEFYFAKKRGYKGIITIDGNNKDSIEDVPKFIEKLKQGFDFVQGSRFIKGGKQLILP